MFILSECGRLFYRETQWVYSRRAFRDTVSSVGIVRAKTLPGTTSGMEHVCYFRHALALDERRVKFLPEYAHAGSTLPADPDSTHSDVDATEIGQSLPSPDNEMDGLGSYNTPHTKEVWFAGTHSDM